MDCFVAFAPREEAADNFRNMRIHFRRNTPTPPRSRRAMRSRFGSC